MVVEEVGVASAVGVEDTKEFYKKDYASFGLDYSSKWKELILKDNTNVKFTNYLGHGSIKAIEWRNLSYCRFLNLSHCYFLTSIDVSCLKGLNILIIWASGLKIVDLLQLLDLEIIICGNYYNGGRAQ